MTARWYEAQETRVTASQSTHRSEWSSPTETQPREKGSRRSGVDQTRERGIHCSPCCKCGSVGRRCFACCSGDARDAEDNVVDRKHDRAHMRTTGQSTTGDRSTDSHLAQVRDAHGRLGSDSDVVMLEQESDGMHGPCVTFLSNSRTSEFFPEQEAGAVALASRAQTI